MTAAGPDLGPAGGPGRVLVVEDDPSVRGLLHTLLSAEGYDVVTASDGLAGLIKASATNPALILLDLMMPDLGGVRVLEELREDPHLSATPVIVVTGKVDAVPATRAAHPRRRGHRLPAAHRPAMNQERA